MNSEVVGYVGEVALCRGRLTASNGRILEEIGSVPIHFMRNEPIFHSSVTFYLKVV